MEIELTGLFSLDEEVQGDEANERASKKAKVAGNDEPLECDLCGRKHQDTCGKCPLQTKDKIIERSLNKKNSF